MNKAQPASSAAWVTGLLNMFASQGIDTDSLLAAAGIEAARSAQPQARFDLQQVNRLWQLAVARSGQETLGLDRALVARHADFAVATRGMAVDGSLRQALATLSEYLDLTDDAAAFTLQRDHPDTWLTVMHGTGPEVPRQRVEYEMLTILVGCQLATGRLIRPLAAEFVFPGPADAHWHRMAFPCPLRFGRPANRLRFAGDDLERSVSGSAPSIHLMEERVLEALLAGLGPARTSFRVAQELLRRLREGVSLAPSLGTAVGLTEAQLARQLNSEGYTLPALLDRVRREMAHAYLEASNLPPGRIAQLLGLGSEDELQATCRRWFGLGPAEYRLQQRPQALD